MSGHGRRSRGGGHGGGGGGHGGWLVTYADLLTLLMVLFLVLWVIAQLDLKKFEEFKEGLGDFGEPAAEAGATAAGAESAAATTTTIVVDSNGNVIDPVTVPASSVDANGALTGVGMDELSQTLQQAVDIAGLTEVVTLIEEERGLIISLSTDDLLFDSGSATLQAGGIDALSVLAPALQGFTNVIEVAGHTDKRPLARAGYTNFDLSLDRAGSVVKLLADVFALPPERLRGTGYGSTRPVAEGDDPESLARNRRVEIIVLASAAPTTAPAATEAAVSEPVPAAAEPAEPADQATDPAHQATDPAHEATDPAHEASDPAAADDGH